MSELLLGCGHSREKRLMLNTLTPEWQELVTLDNNEDCKPDIYANLNDTKWINYFETNQFAEVHAYEVLEHLGQQGDVQAFFDIFNGIYDVLQPNGYLFATVPSRFGPWLWGDPGHRRAITQESISFLDQTTYDQCGFTTLSDYRSIYKSDFRVISSTDDKITHSFILQAVKPARIKL